MPYCEQCRTSSRDTDVKAYFLPQKIGGPQVLCSNCLKNTLDEYPYKIQEPIDRTNLRCPNCGSPITLNKGFCPYCKISFGDIVKTKQKTKKIKSSRSNQSAELSLEKITNNQLKDKQTKPQQSNIIEKEISRKSSLKIIVPIIAIVIIIIGALIYIQIGALADKQDMQKFYGTWDVSDEKLLDMSYMGGSTWTFYNNDTLLITNCSFFNNLYRTSDFYEFRIEGKKLFFTPPLLLYDIVSPGMEKFYVYEFSENGNKLILVTNYGIMDICINLYKR
jgi:hypothetical protein